MSRCYLVGKQLADQKTLEKILYFQGKLIKCRLKFKFFELTVHYFFKRCILAENMCLHCEVDVGGGLLELPAPESTENIAV